MEKEGCISILTFECEKYSWLENLKRTFAQTYANQSKTRIDHFL